MSGGRPLCPGGRHGGAGVVVVDHEDQLVVVVAVHDLDVDPGVRHRARDLAELARGLLIESLDQRRATLSHGDVRFLERPPRRGLVVDEEVRDRLAVDHEHAASVDAHTGAAERFAHRGQRAGLVVEVDREVVQGSASVS